MNPSPKNQHQKRLEVIFFFYHHFVIRYSLKQTRKYLKTKNFDSYQTKIIDYIFNHFDVLHEQISANLSQKWSFSEISNLEKAILFVAIAEIRAHQVPKAIVISEAVKISRTYCLQKNYTYINRVIDNIFRDLPAKTKKKEKNV